ncbi:arsenate reductase ArsC [Thermodesulfobacterium sp. TA1]|uniref:arsenate reductase ArsC n=1 Tax=Thermodesulfobacterium sp. TA1 TaxID=2234087 RepID=UPI00123270AD|nr:arsenate reductase ArsC [Thermodesulfobacterium sp. TA1]QER42842.1 arsenate reductase ArsC [Thermodesulfobacterium sp. TA1]
MKIAFICTGNSARSQMAEGYAKHFANLYGVNVEVYSAGSKPEPVVNPLVIKVMAEDGIDITSQYPKSIEEIPLAEVDLVITLCGDAQETCPYFPAQKREHWGLDDPAKAKGTEEEKLGFFRKIRDEIKERVKILIFSFKRP